VINIIQYLDEAINLEYKVSELYHLFSINFIEDKDFWWQLEIEEKNHAALLKSGKSFFDYGKFPETIFPANLEQLQESILKVDTLISSFNSSWTRKNALDAAIELENSAGEIHFQDFMKSQEESDIAEIFRKLNRNDSDHSQRLTDYILKHGIE
jgi:ferritin